MNFVRPFLLAMMILISASDGFCANAIKFDKSQLVDADKTLKEHRPDYPLAARREHKTGSGVFILNIDKAGKVASIDIKKSTGHRVLDEAARSAFIAWRFKPNTVTKVWIPITYSMTSAPGSPFVMTMPNRPRDEHGRYLTGSGVALGWVDRNTGNLMEVKVVTSTGHKELDNYAREQLLQWKFKPGGPFTVSIPFTFTDRTAGMKVTKPTGAVRTNAQ